MKQHRDGLQKTGKSFGCPQIWRCSTMSQQPQVSPRDLHTMLLPKSVTRHPALHSSSLMKLCSTPWPWQMCTGDAQSPTCEKWTQMNFVLMLGRSFWLVSTESTLSLWSEKSGRDIFQAIMSHKWFHQISRVLRFDDKLSRPRQAVCLPQGMGLLDTSSGAAVQRHLCRWTARRIQRQVQLQAVHANSRPNMI